MLCISVPTKMHQVDNYVVEDNEQKTTFIGRIQIVFANGVWKEKL